MTKTVSCRQNLLSPAALISARLLKVFKVSLWIFTVKMFWAVWIQGSQSLYSSRILQFQKGKLLWHHFKIGTLSWCVNTVRELASLQLLQFITIGALHFCRKGVESTIQGHTVKLVCWTKCPSHSERQLTWKFRNDTAADRLFQDEVCSAIRHLVVLGSAFL